MKHVAYILPLQDTVGEKVRNQNLPGLQCPPWQPERMGQFFLCCSSAKIDVFGAKDHSGKSE